METETLSLILLGLYFFIGLSLAVAIFIRMSDEGGIFGEGDEDSGCSAVFAALIILGSFIFIWPAIIVGAQIAKLLPHKKQDNDEG